MLANNRIMFFSMSLNKGGAERVISVLCNNGLGNDCEMHIVTCLEVEPQYLLKDNVIRHKGFISLEEYRNRGKIKTLPIFCQKYQRIVEKIDPDIIISFLPEPCFIAAMCHKRVGRIVIGSERGNPYYRYRSRIYRMLAFGLYPKLDGFVFQTEGARAFFGKRLQQKSIIIGNPVSVPDCYQYLPEKRKKEIVSVGRFTPEKNYPMLLRAFQKVVKKEPEYILKIYGQKDERLKLEEMVKNLGIENKVFFMGQEDDILNKIQYAAVFVLSSISEGMPNALMEAMAIGLPVVATDCPSGGPRQLIQDGINGLLVPNDNEEALATAILRLIEDESLRRKLSENAVQIAEKYAEQKICKQWIGYIEKLVEGER